MITVVMKDYSTHANIGDFADRNGQILMVSLKDELVAEFNDTWSHWYEHDDRVTEVRKEE